MTTNQTGRRYSTLSDVEVRTADDGKVHVEGHAAMFDSPTMIGPPGVGFEERIAKGAFAKTIADGADVRLLFNHNPDLVLARSKSGTLGLVEDRVGLKIEADLAPTTVGRDLAVLLKRGDVSQMSFGFQVVKDSWATEQRGGETVETRTILEAKLFDVSAVTYPAYNDTDVAIREATLARELRGQSVPEVRVAAVAEVDADADEDPGTLAQAVDESLDSALTVWDANPAQAKALVVAAAASCDALLTVLGASDPDETEGRSAHPNTARKPAAATSGEVDERSFTLTDHLLRHADGGHATAPRALCPACAKPEPDVSTPAA